MQSPSRRSRRSACSPLVCWCSSPAASAPGSSFRFWTWLRSPWCWPYRVPAPFLPGWLRAEIDAGIRPVARPDFGDKVILALFLTIFVLGNIGLLAYLVFFHGGPACA